MKRLLLACLLASLAIAGCVSSDADGTAVTTIDAPPSGTPFKPVGLFFGHSCGTLDCHGQIGRNFRVYSQYGLRLDPMNQPGGSLETSDEFEATFRSAVALEPELTSEVVAEGGAIPDRLTLVRKPRLEESHKGGQIYTVGDPRDVCLTSWLASNVDTTSCKAALQTW
jgi:hypothetical protein